MSMDHASVARRTALTGMGCALAAASIFSINDAAIKFLSGGYALHQIVLIRSIIAMAVLFALVLPFAGGLRALYTSRPGLHALRGGLVIISNMSFFLGLAALPIATAVALFFVAPLLITALSVVILGEKVGPRRWGAVIVGLVGVVVMLRPGVADFQPAMLLPLLAALAYALMHMMTRRMAGSESAATMTVYVQLTFIVTSVLIGALVGDGRFAGGSSLALEFLLRPWHWPAPADWPLLATIGLASAFGALLMAQAYRLGEAALIAPFEYVNMPLAILMGLVIFGEWPDALAWLGITLICGAGLYMLWRETQVRAPVVLPPPSDGP